MRRRKRLIVHDPNPSIGFDRFEVGYWDGNTGNPGRDFRSFGGRITRDEAEALAREVVRKNPEFSYPR
jgi:hypothetical protein